ncbi:MAG: HAMP domain-containing histidine kinase [Nocardioidaceae bacterium]|nr:HAMP domain-containing histidine kinase [Nocardioidaceae bacterium]
MLIGLLRFLTAPLRKLVYLWRRSIQARVVIGTLTLSAVLAVLAGWVLLRQVTDGLLDSKQQSALTQAAAGVDTAQSRLNASPEVGDFSDVGSTLNQLIEVLAPRDEVRDDYLVVVIGPFDPFSDNPVTGGSRASNDELDPASIPANLMERVQGSSRSWFAYSEVRFQESSVASLPGLVVGSQIRVPTTGEAYALFYVFSLEEQQQTLFVVRNALITTGALLVVLLGTIAWLVTRQVVTPVRLARRIAERLAAGRLEERMHVRGADDIARLGVSFNQMASGLQNQIRQLEELSRVQRRFVADVSHELRTPLTTVRMAADVLHDARPRFDPATARSAELLQNELDRFEALLTDLLEISRFDAGAAVLELSDVDVRDVVRSVVEGAAPLAERRGSSVVVEVAPRPCIAEVDVRRLERIVRNLVVNAIEYGEGNPIEVRVATGDGTVALTVRDHGVGLQPGEETMVFNRFWRADPARARTRGGTGLGLSIAVEDTTLHGGRLDAWGQVGRGAQFRLTLPGRAGDPLGTSPLPRVPVEHAPIGVGAPYASYPHGSRGGVR